MSKQKAFVCYKQYNTHKLLHTVTMFLTQSFSAASAVQTDSSFGLKIAFISLAYNWWVFLQLCN